VFDVERWAFSKIFPFVTLTIHSVPKLNHLFYLVVLILVSSAVAQTVAEQQVTFTYIDTKAKEVFIAGEFNHSSTTATPMKRAESGKWTAQVASICKRVNPVAAGFCQSG
jgi:hypothetical protein